MKITRLTKETILNTQGEFLWGWNHIWFIITPIGNFIWSDPDYPDGDNTFNPTDLSYEQWLRKTGIPFARNKGTHTISQFCGNNIELRPSHKFQTLTPT